MRLVAEVAAGDESENGGDAGDDSDDDRNGDIDKKWDFGFELALGVNVLNELNGVFPTPAVIDCIRNTNNQ